MDGLWLLNQDEIKQNALVGCIQLGDSCKPFSTAPYGDSNQ